MRYVHRLIFLHNTAGCSTHTYSVPLTATEVLLSQDRTRVWNSLPAIGAYMRKITSYGQFRQHLKTHLFRA